MDSELLNAAEERSGIPGASGDWGYRDVLPTIALIGHGEIMNRLHLYDLWWACLAAGLLIIARPCAAAEPTDDPIMGKWYGMAGFPQDRVELGIEFRYNEKQEIVAALYQPVANYYNTSFPGVVNRQDDQYINSKGFFSLTLKDDKLEGTYFPHKVPISLSRTDKLPAEVPVPDFPAAPHPRWQTKLGGEIYAPAEVRDGAVYVGSTNGMFHALDSASGKILWMFVAGRPIHGAATATEDAIYFACDNGFFFKLERKTGKEIWRYDLGDAQSSRVLVHPETEEMDWDLYAPRPLIVGNVAYLGVGDGGFHAIDVDSGLRKWRFAAGAKIRGDAVVHGGNVLFASFDMNAYAVDRETGKEVWRSMTRGPVTSSPAIVEGKLIVGNRGSVLTSLDPATGEKDWTLHFWGSSVESVAAPYERLFYIGSSDLRRISAIDPVDGRVLWRTDIYGWAWGRPAVTETTIYAAAVGYSPYEIRQLGSLTALDRKSGQVLWRWPVPQCPGSLVDGFAASPVVCDKTVFVGGLNGCFYALPAS